MNPATAPPEARRTLGLFLVLGLAACARAPEVWFREVARERGLAWTHVSGKTQRYWFPEIIGGGVGLLDYDGDGALDVYLVQSGDLDEPSADDTSRLFRSLGGARFADVTGAAGGAEPGYGMGCACADADGDGDTDIYVTKVGRDALWSNDAAVFHDATERAGVGDTSWSTSAAWFDLDVDGDLDLYVANYVRWSSDQEIVSFGPQGGRDYASPRNYQPTRDVLYQNQGAGRMRDVSEEAGLSAAFGNGLGVQPLDHDADGWIDVFVANDMMPNQLWKNRGDGTFVDQALFAGCAVNLDGAPESGMGVAAPDLDDDGDRELFITTLRKETSTLFSNQGGTFTDRTGALGLGPSSVPFTGFGVGFQDFDLDGLLDLYVANGDVIHDPATYDPSDPYAQPNQLFRGGLTDGREPRFEEFLPRGGTRPELLGRGRGTAFGDLDADGDVDVVVVENSGHVLLLENVAATGHWVGLRVLERTGGDAQGARLAIECADRVRYRWVESSGSYCSSNDPRVSVGLGACDDPVTVTVRWVDRSEERFGPLASDRWHLLRRGAGAAGGR